MDSSMKQLNDQITQTGLQLRQTLQEITRQQQEQKAQSTIQLCEALITSLGTLKSSIAHQLDDNQPVDASMEDALAAIGHSAPVGDPPAFAPSETEAEEPEPSSDEAEASSDAVVDNAAYSPFSATEAEAAPNPAEDSEDSADDTAGEPSGEQQADGAIVINDNADADTESDDEEEEYPPPIY